MLRHGLTATEAGQQTGRPQHSAGQPTDNKNHHCINTADRAVPALCWTADRQHKPVLHQHSRQGGPSTLLHSRQTAQTTTASTQQTGRSQHSAEQPTDNINQYCINTEDRAVPALCWTADRQQRPALYQQQPGARQLGTDNNHHRASKTGKANNVFIFYAKKISHLSL